MATFIDGSTVNINETVLTSGAYQGVGYSFTGSANQLTEKDFTLDHDIDLLAGTYYNDDCQSGDKVGMQVRIGQVGVLTAAASIGATTVSVNSTVTDNVLVGHWVSFDGERAVEGSKSEYLVTAVDAGAGTLTILPADRTGGLDEAYSANDTVFLVIKMIICRGVGGYEDLLPCMPGEQFIFGAEKLGGSGIPAGKRIRVSFENSHATTDRTVTVIMPHLY